MANYHSIEGTPRGRNTALIVLLALVVLTFVLGRSILSYLIEYRWWHELGQTSTWFTMLGYSIAPLVLATLIAAIVLWTAHSMALRFAGTSLRYYPLYAKLSILGALVLGFFFAAVVTDTWTVVRFFGGSRLDVQENAWHDPVFGHSLVFYFFQVPFYSLLLRFVLGLSVVAALVYWLTARGWQLREQMPRWQDKGVIELQDLGLSGAIESRFLRGLAVVFLIGLAVKFYLDRYTMLLNEHAFMVGVDWVNEHVSLPLQWLTILGAVAAAALVWMRRPKLAAAMLLVLPVRALVPVIANAVYVRPNEISIQRPYIERHIQATRSAFRLDRNAKEIDFPAKLDTKVDRTKHQALLENVRLWDWRAFHDTVTQIQALRPYYAFADSDVDRYQISGKINQVLLSPREFDIRQLAGAQASWVNQRFIYTHGYGLVMAEANRITPEGLPVLFVRDAPPVVETDSLRLTRPEIYYGEVVHEPVFVRTAQPEFNYPSGSENVHSRYEGKGGFPVSSWPMRIAAAVTFGDWNIVLTQYLTPESRMMIRRNISGRLRSLAGFINWDPDPYLVLTDEGRLVWMIDGFTTSRAHPYSRSIQMQGVGEFNYMRNSVKATIDAYDGSIDLFIFDSADPIIQSYAKLFPALFKPAAEMPADMRRHARYPEVIFRAQAEIYRTFHMRDPESFYNKEDLWDLGKNISGQGGRAEAVNPTYVVATMPGSNVPEFLLVIPFTPRNKDNLIGLMMARCDGENLGELVFLQLSKQELIFGPMQIEARINQDQFIAKDLALWSQQGSQVLRGHILVLPLEDSFLYVEPIYIQASEARMPQLRKIVMAMGNRLIYADNYEQAVAALTGTEAGEVGTIPVSSEIPPPSAMAPSASAPPAQPATAPPPTDKRIETIRDHLRRYRDFAAQGRWAEAGKELEAIQSVAGSR